MPHITADKLKAMREEITSLRVEVASLKDQLKSRKTTRQRKVAPEDNQQKQSE